MTDEFSDSFKNALGRLSKEVREESIGEESETLQKVLEELEFSSFDSIEGELISEGGMKKVYRIKDSASKRSVAKAVLKYPDSDPHVLLRFIHEARITALLEHPNIVPVYQVKHSDGEPYFIMKELKGSTLGEVLNDSTYDLTALLNIFLKVCDAIAYAHSKNIVHLDLKPDNIHVGEFGEVLVMDWGLAKDLNEKETSENTKSVSDDPLNTLDGQIKGTIGYMSPEQARAENDRKNEKSDIYALGSILYHILSKEAPYDNKDPHKTLLKIAKGEFKPLGSEVPAALASVVRKALALKQNERFSSVSELSNDIKRYLAGFSPHSEEATGWKKLILFVGRHKLPFIVASVFSVILTMTTFLFIQSLKEKESVALKNAEKARENELAAIKNMEKSNELYKQLLSSMDKNEKLVDMSLPLAMKKVADYTYSLRFEAARSLLLKIYSEDIEDAEYWRRLGQLYLGEFEYEKGLKYLKKSLIFPQTEQEKSQAKMMFDAFDGVDLKIGDVDGLFEFIGRTKKLKYLEQLKVQIFYNVYNKWGLSIAEKEKFLDKALQVMNHKKIHYKLTKYGDLYGIDFSNNPNITNITPLAGFPLVRVNFSNCENLTDMKWIRGYGIKYLNISGSKSNDHRFLHFMHGLEELVMSDIIIHSVSFRRIAIKKLDLKGSVVNLADLYNPYMKELNLCSAKVSNLEQLKNLSNLEKVILPEGVKLGKGILDKLQKSKLEIIDCTCGGNRRCTFSLK